jgi:hypothetical protein
LKSTEQSTQQSLFKRYLSDIIIVISSVGVAIILQVLNNMELPTGLYVIPTLIPAILTIVLRIYYSIRKTEDYLNKIHESIDKMDNKIDKLVYGIEILRGLKEFIDTFKNLRKEEGCRCIYGIWCANYGSFLQEEYFEWEIQQIESKKLQEVKRIISNKIIDNNNNSHSLYTLYNNIYNKYIELCKEKIIGNNSNYKLYKSDIDYFEIFYVEYERNGETIHKAVLIFNLITPYDVTPEIGFFLDEEKNSDLKDILLGIKNLFIYLTQNNKLSEEIHYSN